MADVLVKYPDIIVISDEIYEHINFTQQHASMAHFEDMYDRTVTVNGVSKAFSMTGWRIGYIGAPEYIARALSSSLLYTEPLGLQGLLYIIIFVFGVMAFSSSCGVTLKSVSIEVFISTGTPPATLEISL